MFLVFCVLFTICLVFHFVNSNNTKGEVIFVNVVFRHGDRTPYIPYPTDPYDNTSYWPDGFAQLTNMGKEQQFELGNWLRGRYDALLTETYSHDKIYAQSIDLDRSLMSAQCNLAGMYPPKKDQIWNEDIHWQPIPVHTVPEKLDNMLATKEPCPAYEEEFQRILQTKEIQELNDSFHDVFEILNQYSGEHVTTIKQIYWLYGTLWTENLYNLSLPKWTKSIFPRRMEEASIYNYVLPTYNTKLARLKLGVLVKDLISNMKLKMENDPGSHNLKVYSVTGTALGNLMNTLGVNNMILPPYAACLMMELSVDSAGDYHVTVRVLVKDLISNMKLKMENDPGSHNLKVYSVTGTALGNLMNTLGVNNMILPPYAACLMMELSVDSAGDYHVTMFYRNFTIGEPYPLTLPGCTLICPLPHFIRLLEPVTIFDWESECQEKSRSVVSTLIIIALMVLMSLLLMMLTSGVIYGLMRKRSAQTNTN